MKESGFTLIELLGVIIVLGVLVVIVGVTVTNVLKDSETKLTDVQIEKLKDAAKNYYINEGMEDIDFEQDNFSHCVNVNYLIENGYVDKNEISNFETGEEMLGSIRINYNNKKYEYTYTEDSCKVCSLINDAAPAGISPGDKYQCKVKDDMETGFEDGYYFFVLGTNEDGTTNLIMERNMYYDSTNDVGLVATKNNTGLVAWMNQTDYESAGGTDWSRNTDRNMFGPVTAMNYLYNATKDWGNVPNIKINYKDEGNTGSYGYGTIITINNITKITKKDGSAVTVLTDKEGYTNLKSRMPRNDEVHEKGKCLTYAENGNRYGSCPLWLANYMSSSSYVTGAGLQNIDGIYGYWLLSSYASHSYFACFVNSSGNVSDGNLYFSGSYGLRPVITLPKNRFEDGNW